jgi:hypothetical protein
MNLVYWDNGYDYPVVVEGTRALVQARPGRRLPTVCGELVRDKTLEVVLDLEVVLPTQHVAPVVGTPATIHVGSDQYPATVVHVSESGRRVLLQRDDVRGRGVFVSTERTDVATRSQEGLYFVGGKRTRQIVCFGVRASYSSPEF